MIGATCPSCSRDQLPAEASILGLGIGNCGSDAETPGHSGYTPDILSYIPDSWRAYEYFGNSDGPRYRYGFDGSFLSKRVDPRDSSGDGWLWSGQPTADVAERLQYLGPRRVLREPVPEDSGANLPDLGADYGGNIVSLGLLCAVA